MSNTIPIETERALKKIQREARKNTPNTDLIYKLATEALQDEGD